MTSTEFGGRPARSRWLPWILFGGAAILVATQPLAMPESLLVAREGHTATVLADGRVLVVGGENETGVLASCEWLEGDRAIARPAATLADPRTGHVAILLGDGRVLIAGGRGPGGPLATTEVYDPATDAFAPGPSMSRARTGHSATSLGDGRVLVAGGDSQGSAEIYDPAQNGFVLLPFGLLEPRRRHGALRLADGAVFIAGGEGAGGAALDSAEVFVEATGFEPVRGWMHATRTWPELRLLPDGKVQILGGDEKGTLEIFDPRGRYFRASTRPELARPTLTFTEDGPAIVAEARGPASTLAFNPPQRSYHGLDVPLQVAPRGGVNVLLPEPASRLFIGGVAPDGTRLDAVRSIAASAATISTERIDHLALKRPYVSGTGWAPFERVRIVRQLTSHREPGEVVEPTVMYASADEQGGFRLSDPYWAPYRPNATWLLTAVGLASRRVAQTAHFDAPQPDPSRAPIADGPRRVDLAVPVRGAEGEVATELGTLRWSDWTYEDGTRAPVPPFDPLVLSDDMFSFLGDCLPTTPSGSPCINEEGKVQVCFEVSGGDDDDGDGDGNGEGEGGAETVDVEGCVYLSELHGGIWLDGTLDTRIDFDPGEGEIYPELRDHAISSHIGIWTDPQIEVLVGLDLTVTFEVPLIPLPATRSFEIADSGIRGDITIPNIYLGISGGVEGFTVRPYLQVGEVLSEGPDPPREIDPVSFTPRLVYWEWEDIGVDFCSQPGDCEFRGAAGVDLVDAGEAEVKLFLQAKAAAAVTSDLVIAEVHAWIDLGTGPYLRGRFDLGGLFGTCEPFHADVDAGFEAWCSAGAFVQWPCIDINCDWVCTGWCWNPWGPDPCCWGYFDCEIDCPTWDFDILDWSGDWPLDIVDFLETGELTLIVTTSGVDLDPDGYQVVIAASDLDPDAPNEPQWDVDYTMTVPPNGSVDLSGGTCVTWWGDEQTCDPLAAYHDIGVTPATVMWNCTVPEGMSMPEVCVDDGAELEIEVRCKSVFEVLQGNVGQLYLEEQIANPRIATELTRLLARAAAARDRTGGTPVAGLSSIAPAAGQSWCKDHMGRFLDRVQAYVEEGEIGAAAADLLRTRAEQVRDFYCGATTVAGMPATRGAERAIEGSRKNRSR